MRKTKLNANSLKHSTTNQKITQYEEKNRQHHCHHQNNNNHLVQLKQSNSLTMLDAINPPTSPYSVDIDMIDDSGAATPILSSQADDIILPSEDPESPTNPNATGTSSSTTTNTATNKINAGGATTTSTTKSSSSSSSSGGGVIGDSESSAQKRHKPGPTAGKRPSAETLQRRKEGRIKAAATLAQNLAKTGIGRFENENGFNLTSIKPILVINQKNYFTDYLKKDEQVSFIRNWRQERALQQKMKKLKQQQQQNNQQNNQQQLDNGEKKETKNFDDFNLNDIELEMKKEMAVSGGTTTTGAGNDDDEEVDDEENETEEVRQEKAKIGEDVIVLQPGSRYIRIGKATDAVPLVIPNVIAVKKNLTNIDNPHGDDSGIKYPKRKLKQPKPSSSTNKHDQDDENEEELEYYIDEEFDEQKAIVTKDFRARMRYYKRRILPNSRETVINFNKRQVSEKIEDHNDPNKKEWINPDKQTNKRFFVGEDALNLATKNPNQVNTSKDGESQWILRYPMINGNFNENSYYYESREEILGDICNIIFDALNQLEITTDVNKYKVMLLIPDLYDKAYVETWCQLLLKFIGFGKVGIIQESIATTFGATMSTACVVDVGAQTTKISCVDEGMIISDSRVLLNYGGDNITETFVKLLIEDQFPYRDINLINAIDWELAQNLKEKYITFQDADIAIQLYEFYKRKPFESTEKFTFKIFDEVMLAPMGLFFPKLFQITGNKHPSIPNYYTLKNPTKSTVENLFSKSLDQYNNKPNNPKSKSQDQLKLKNQLNYCDLTDEELLLKLINQNDNENDTTEKDDEHQHQSQVNGTSTTTTSKTKNNEDQLLSSNFDGEDERLVEVPLEKAIIESITNAGLSSDLTKLKKFYDNIIIVGGGLSKINGYDLILNDRLNIWRPRILSTSAIDLIIKYLNEEIKKNLLKKENLIEIEQERIKQEMESTMSGDNNNSTTNNNNNQEETTAQNNNINVSEIEVPEDIMERINNETELKLDLDYIEELIEENGQFLSMNIVPTPREFDPSMINWKGGSVYSRLKVVNEMWITQNDWDLLGSRSLYYKSIFNY